MAYPIFGLSDLKLYLPEINQFVDIKPRSEYREMQERLQEQVWSYAQNEKSKGAEYEKQIQSYRAALLTQHDTLSNLGLAENLHECQSKTASCENDVKSQSHHDSKVDTVHFEDDKDFGFAYIPPKKAQLETRRKTNFSRGLLLFRLRAKTYSRKDPAEKGYESA
ncbi:unnamed protein product [Lymnaea stagnalis]|uniref:Uncharacterized protein n=1 Tax=Lymnaea stagnalis TaxID=6523 RepID=A0AAV2H874_LYMST